MSNVRRLRPAPKKSRAYLRMIVVLAVTGFCIMNLQTVKAHVEVDNNAAVDSLSHFLGQIGDDQGENQTFRDWSPLGVNGDANPANAYCRVVVEKFNIPNNGINPRAVYKFKVVGNSDARSHVYEAGAYADSTTSNCENEFNNAWNGRTVDLGAPLFRNPVANPVKTRPISVKLGVTGSDVSNSTPRKSNGDPALLEVIDDWWDFDWQEKAAAGVKARTDGGTYGMLSDGGGFKVGPNASNMQTIWCAGIDIGNIPNFAAALGRSTNIRWPGSFYGDCRYDYRFKSGTNTPGDGNFQTNWGAYVRGAMGSSNASGQPQTAGALRCISISCPIGSDIPGITRDGNGMVNNFELHLAGIKNHDGAGTYNGNPSLANDPDFGLYGLSADLRAFYQTPNPYKVAFAEAWMTVEWDGTGGADPDPDVSCTVSLRPTVPEPGQNFTASMQYIYKGPATVLRAEAHLVGVPDGSVVRTEAVQDTGGVEVTGEIPLDNYVGAAGRYDYNARIQMQNRPDINASCDDKALIAAKPYFKVWSNDVSVGGGFPAADGTCSVLRDDATIIGYGGGDTADLNRFRGSSAEYAVSALGEVRNFFSAGRRSPRAGPASAWPVPPHGLTFANAEIEGIDGPDPIDGNKVENYGGLSGVGSCAEDWLAAIPDDAQSLGGNVIDVDGVNGAAVNNSNGVVYIDGGAVNSTKTIFVPRASDVVIRGDINANENQRATLYIIAEGNIKVTSSVDRIDAVLVTKSTLYTCVQDDGGLWSSSVLFSSCGGRGGGSLTIRGAVVANAVKLLRTEGTRNSSVQNEGRGGQAAEEIIFDPMLYLTPPALATPARENAQIDFITSLPPIL